MILGNLEFHDGGPIWPTFRNHDVIPESCDVIKMRTSKDTISDVLYTLVVLLL